ncbi:putative gustatory receptor 98b [Lucilia cuprina]|uniref:Gustatory receptor n=1 Tax=Lucilia cuprina TaxID=7375 RepID=A0A0L0C6B3_LUCCU|nr:putative gustatory receptor 98b [Lucilia cuprina]
MENNFEKDIIEKSQLLQATYIFQWIFCLIGINLPPLLNCYPKGYSKKVIKFIWCCFVLYTAFLMALVIWIVYVNNLVVDFVVFKNDLDSITSVLSISVNIVVAFVQVICQSVAILKHKCFKMILKRIAQLERDILLYFQEYQWLQDNETLINFHHRCEGFRRYISLLFGLYSLVFGILISYMNYHLVASFMNVRDKILTLACTLAIQFKAVEYCIIVQIINEFLTCLQSSLKRLKCDIAKCQEKPFMAAVFHGKLMANQFLMNRVWFLITDIEEYFAVPMLILYLYNGIAITHTINWTYVRSFDYLKNDLDCGMYQSETDYILKTNTRLIFSLKFYFNNNTNYAKIISDRLYYIILTFVTMLLPCWMTQLCIDKYNQFGSILHNIKSIDDIALNFRIREYSLQLKQQKMLFSCSGYFNINLKYFGLVIEEKSIAEGL